MKRRQSETKVQTLKGRVSELGTVEEQLKAKSAEVNTLRVSFYREHAYTRCILQYLNKYIFTGRVFYSAIFIHSMLCRCVAPTTYPMACERIVVYLSFSPLEYIGIFITPKCRMN